MRSSLAIVLLSACVLSRAETTGWGDRYLLDDLADGRTLPIPTEVGLDAFDSEGAWTCDAAAFEGIAECRRLKSPDGTPALGLRAEFFGRRDSTLDIEAARPLRVCGDCLRLSLRVLGRNWCHRLSIIVLDYYGEPHDISLGAMNFSGWKRLEALVPRPDPAGGGIVQDDRHYDREGGLRIAALRIHFDAGEAYGRFYAYFADMQALCEIESGPPILAQEPPRESSVPPSAPPPPEPDGAEPSPSERAPDPPVAVREDTALTADEAPVPESEPAEPGELVEPVEPVEPAESVEPAAPAEPAELVEPAAPVEPAELVEPAALAEPAEPAAKTEPAETAETAEPADTPSAQLPPPAPAETPAPAPRETAQDRERRILGGLNDSIAAAQTYPAAARRRGLEGAAAVLASIAADGSLLSARIATSSGSDILDQAALDLVSTVFPLSEPMGRPVSVRLKIAYRLENP